jgi:hypothetical protein
MMSERTWTIPEMQALHGLEVLDLADNIEVKSNLKNMVSKISKIETDLTEIKQYLVLLILSNDSILQQ